MTWIKDLLNFRQNAKKLRRLEKVVQKLTEDKENILSQLENPGPYSLSEEELQGQLTGVYTALDLIYSYL